MSVQSNLRMAVSLSSSYHLQMTLSLLPYLLETSPTHMARGTKRQELKLVLPGSTLASKLITMHHALETHLKILSNNTI